MRYEIVIDDKNASYLILKQNDNNIVIHRDDLKEVSNLLSGIKPDDECTMFNEFWTLYPKKQAKKTALRAWNKLCPNKHLVETIIKAVEKSLQDPQWSKEGGAFIPMPSTWINQERWNDFIEINHNIKGIDNEW